MSSKKPPLTPTVVANLVSLPVGIASYKRLAEIGDKLVDRYLELLYGSRRIARDEAKLALTCSDLEAIKHAQTLFAALDPADSYEEDRGALKRTIVGDRVALMLGAYPRNSIDEPQIYTGMLIAHIVNAAPTWPALNGACMALEAGRASPPPISVMLEKLREEQVTWELRRVATFDLARLSATRVEQRKRVRAEANA